VAPLKCPAVRHSRGITCTVRRSDAQTPIVFRRFFAIQVDFLEETPAGPCLILSCVSCADSGGGPMAGSGRLGTNTEDGAVRRTVTDPACQRPSRITALCLATACYAMLPRFVNSRAGPALRCPTMELRQARTGMPCPTEASANGTNLIYRGGPAFGSARNEDRLLADFVPRRGSRSAKTKEPSRKQHQGTTALRALICWVRSGG
jgi:hypothetical protein